MGTPSGASTARPPSESTRVLCVDDDTALAGLISEFLERESDRISTLVAPGGREGLELVAEEGVDCIVSDYEMPEMDGLEFLDAIRQDRPDLPFILFTGKGSEEVAAEAISREVTDYLQKESGTEQYAVLANRIHNVVDQYRAEKRSEARERQLKALHRTTREALTAETAERVCEIGVEAACDVLGARLTTVHLYRESTDELVPVAVSDALADLDEAVPTFPPDSSIARRVYEEGDSLYLEDVRDDPDVFDLETPIRGGMFLPLGDHGVLVVGSQTTAPFDRTDRTLVELLASNLTATLDRTERECLLRKREHKLEQEIERLSQIGNIVSHDLRNPLNVANGHLDLARGYGDDPRLEEHLEKVDRAHARAFEIIENVMTFAEQRHGTGEIERVDLASVAYRCWSNVRTDGADLDLEENVVVRADRNRLKHLFENLFRNAVEHGSTSPRSSSTREDAVEHGGTGPAKADGSHDAPATGDLTIRVGPLDEGFGFYVEDDGVGIPPELREEIFDIGYSTDSRDGGFGLSIVEHVCEAHEWEISVAESENGGARFEITSVDVVEGDE